MSKKVHDLILDANKIKPKLISKELPETITVSELSEDSQEVLEHFGIEAPSLLNNYSMALEDALIESVSSIKALKQKYEALKSKYE